MQIRNARIDDASAACDVMRRSIAELCVADYRNDPAVLQRWLGNKTPEQFAAWLVQPNNSIFVATENNAVIAVGAVTDAGEITLNYVAPKARFLGVSRALLDALEARAIERATRTARSPALRPLIVFIAQLATLTRGRQLAHSARCLAIRCPSDWCCINLDRRITVISSAPRSSGSARLTPSCRASPHRRPGGISASASCPWQRRVACQ